MPAAWAIASRISTPGMIGRVGKWPWKKGSLIVTFLSATIRLPRSMVLIRSMSRKGNLWGRCSSTSPMSIASAILLLLVVKALYQQLHAVREFGQVPYQRGVLYPRVVLVERVHAGV